ncbi:hypothetical protein C0J52_03096 [Blattella germanica]|nr:hypothetical protein C0J52_03096 [Blattella germanica]
MVLMGFLLALLLLPMRTMALICPAGCFCSGPPYRATLRCVKTNLTRVAMTLAPGPLDDMKCLLGYEAGKARGFNDSQALLLRLLRHRHGKELILNGEHVTNIHVSPTLDLWIDVDAQAPSATETNVTQNQVKYTNC